MNIQKISAIILLVVLIITMIIVYGMLYYSNSELTYPPMINKCPDTMTYTKDEGCGSNGPKPYEGGGVCEFRKNNQVSEYGNWDGISNAVCD